MSDVMQKPSGQRLVRDASPTHMSHLAIKTRDLKAMRDWYTSVFNGQFPKNGLGTNYDPVVMVEKYRAGIAAKELLAPGSAPGPGCGAR